MRKEKEMLKRLYVDNYRCLVNFEVNFGKLALLLGPNGTGKSSLLDIMFALRQLLSGAAKITDPDIFPAGSLTRWQSRTIQVFEVEVILEDEESMIYRLELEHEPGIRLERVKRELLTAGKKPLFDFNMGEVQLYRDDHSTGPAFSADWSESALARIPKRADNERLSRFLGFMRKILVCGLYPPSFVTESTSEDALPAYDGRNFSAWYRHSLQERQDLVQPFEKAMADVVDDFKGIRLAKVGQDTRAFIVILENQGKRFEIKLDELSDGQRALIALYAFVHLTAGQEISLFLDEPDNYVALPEIQPWLMALSDACGESIPQAVICSHHPELIDYLGGDCGLLMRRESSGVTTVRPLDLAINGGLKLSELVARGWEQ